MQTNTCFITAVMFTVCSTVTPSKCPETCKCDNFIADCSKGTFTFIPNLPKDARKLYLNENKLHNISSESFINITKLDIQTLNLSNCLIDNITAASFTGLKSLKSLNLSHNHLGELVIQRALTGLWWLQELDLSYQKPEISVITYDLFARIHNSSIKVIFLKGNKIKQLDSSVFKMLKNLQKVFLGDNEISNLTLGGIEKISSLYLKLNEMSYFPCFCDAIGHPFTPELEYLDLQENHISNLNKLNKTAICLPNLKELQLSYNPIRFLRNETFSGLRNLTRLHLTHLFTVEIIFEKTALSSGSLTELYVGSSGGFIVPVEYDKFYLFTKLPNLKTLDMANMNLMNTDLSSLLEPLKTLETLILIGCNILQIPQIVSKMTNLKNLMLQNNYIAEIHPNIFENLSNLANLSLHDNRITIITETSFPKETLHRLQKLDLRYNPFSCNCDLYWFRYSVMQKRANLLIGDPSNATQYRCFSPRKMEHRGVSTYQPSYYHCHPLTPYEIAGIVTGSVILALVILGGIYKKYKWHIKYYAYLFRSKRGYHRLEGSDANDFAFDAFVAYNEDDRSWVISSLMPELEGSEEYKLCLHERDFLPGKTIFSQISQTIQRSRKMILVLSNSFAKSQWCQYEALIAQHRLVEDGANVLIIILLGEINSKYLTDSLQMLMRSMTYIQWTSNCVGKELFWNKLKWAMKP